MFSFSDALRIGDYWHTRFIRAFSPEFTMKATGLDIGPCVDDDCIRYTVNYHNFRDIFITALWRFLWCIEAIFANCIIRNQSNCYK